MNELPIMPIRAKYADETAKGVNIDDAIEGSAGDIGALDTRVETLETIVGDAEGGLVKDVADLKTTVGDSSAGLVKKVFDLEGKTQAITHTESGTDVDGALTADSIIENMVGYSFAPSTDTGWTINPVYVGAVKNGNKLTLVFAAEVTHVSGNNLPTLGSINIPSSVASKLTPFQDTTLSVARSIAVDSAYNEKDIGIFTDKGTNSVRFGLNGSNLELNTQYYVRAEVTFLLGDNLAVQP